MLFQLNHWRGLIVLSLALWSAWASPLAAQPATLALENDTLEVSTLINNLDVPWEILWGPDNFIWMTERGGTVSRVNPDTGQKTEILDISDCIEWQESGLLGMVLHPDFAANPYIYLVYTYLVGGSDITERLVRYTYNGTALTDPLILLDGIPGNTTHIGSRLLITPDMKLIMTTGDAQDQPSAQNTDDLTGKFLRLNLDGSIPDDNPIANNPTYTFGHRNAQGLVLASNGIMYSSEHGPTNDDEFNIITANRNYGWPTVHGFCNQPNEITFCNNNDVVEPLAAWTPTLAVAGIDYYNHPAIPDWQNCVLLCAMKAQRLIRMRLSQDGTEVLSQTNYLNNQIGRIRDICISPMGDVYISTSNEDAYGDGTPDRILRLHNPAFSIEAQPSFSSNDTCLSVQFTNTSVDADTYLWDFGDGYTTTDPSPLHLYAQAGTYTVQLTATNIYGSNSTSAIVTVTDCSIGINAAMAQALRLYPNPASLRLYIDYPSELQGGTVEISLLNGQTVYTQSLPINRTTFDLPVDALARGTYIATFRRGSIVVSRVLSLQ